MHENAKRITAFYEAFARRDGAEMTRFYADDARFSDPVFPDLRGKRIGAMWTMLCSRAKDLVIEHSGVEADDASGKAHWRAKYTFSTGRNVINEIDARFRFRDGLCVEHDDVFDFGAWSRQAIGAPAILLGWTGLIQRKVQREAAIGLERYETRART